MENYIIQEFEKDYVDEFTCFSGACNFDELQASIDYIMKRKFSYVEGQGKIAYYFCRSKELGNLQFYGKDFSKYDWNNANCALFYIMLLLSAHNETFKDTAQFYTNPSEVYSGKILEELRGKYNDTDNKLSSILFR